MEGKVRSISDYMASSDQADALEDSNDKAAKRVSVVVAGPDRVYGAPKAPRYSSRRLQIGYHRLTGRSNHEPHAHPTWEQFYFVVAGSALIRVGPEERVVNAGGVAYIAPGVEHSFEAVDGPLEILLAGCVLDD